MKINEELLEIYKTLLKETSDREVSDEEVAAYVEIVLAAELVVTLDRVDAPETYKQLQAFAIKSVIRDIAEAKNGVESNETTEPDSSES